MRQPDKHGREHRKYIRLDKRYKHFQTVKEYPEKHGNHTHGSVKDHAHTCRKEYHGNRAKLHYMPGEHIGKQPYHQ